VSKLQRSGEERRRWVLGHSGNRFVFVRFGDSVGFEGDSSVGHEQFGFVLKKYEVTADDFNGRLHGCLHHRWHGGTVFILHCSSNLCHLLFLILWS
jgi:hypothetical protein